MLVHLSLVLFFFFSSRRRHTRFDCDWSSDVCSSDLAAQTENCNTDADRCNLGSDHCWRVILSHAPICFQSTSVPCRMRQRESRLSFTCASFDHNQWGGSAGARANRDQRSLSSSTAHALHGWRNTRRARPTQNLHIG